MAPGTPSGSIATFIISVNGSPIAATYSIYSIHIEKAVNRIASASILILDGDAASGDFPASSSSTFVPGNTISIAAGYDNINQVIFEGIITAQQLRIDDTAGSALELVCRDMAIKMTVGRKCSSFTTKTDSEIIASITGSYGLAADIASTAERHPQLVQYYTTDWDFIISRAEANGLVATTLNNKISVFAPDAPTTPVLTIGYGEDLLEFNASLNALNQLAEVKASAWDHQNQTIASSAVQMTYTGPGNLSSKTLSAVVGLQEYELQTTGAIPTAELNQWSKAQLVKSGFSKIQGEAKFQGSALTEPGRYITLQGLGDRFNGDHFISQVSHDIADGNWLTGVSIGLSPAWFTEQPDVMAPPAAGLLPGARGLMTGTVKQIANDPGGQYRILVSVPLIDSSEGIWARLAHFYASSSAGAFFIPEVGDEVVVGFLNEDPRYPVILGSFYSSSRQQPPVQPDDTNSLKAIVTRSGMRLSFDELKQSVTLSTPGGNTVKLSDQDKQVSLADEHGNSILLSADGITIRSEKDIRIEARQSVNMNGNQGIRQSSTGDVTMEGTNIKQTATMSYIASGQTATDISSSGDLTLKAAMIMIN